MIFRNIISSMGLTALVAFFSVVSRTDAATVEGSVSPEFSGDTTFNLTDLGTLDWAYWTMEPNPTDGEPTNSKNGGALIGSAVAIGGGGVRGSTTTSGAVPESYFTFSDGITPSSGTDVKITGVFNTQLQKSGAGVSLSLDLPTVQTYTVYVWASAFSLNSSTFTAALSGGTSFVSTVVTDNTSSSAKDTYLFTLTVTPDNPGDDLTISAVAGSSSGSNSHILIGGVAVSLASVPEPGTSAALAGIAALTIGTLARRRRINFVGETASA